MTREEAIAFLDAESTTAPVVRQPPQESLQQYWGRSPLVEQVPEYIRTGANLVGRGAGVLGAAADLPRSAAVAALVEAGRYAAPTIRSAGREAARDIGAGWNAVTWPARYAGRELNRTIVQPLAVLGRFGMDYVGRGVEALEGAAGSAAGRAANWFNRNVVPPPIATPRTRAEYDALPPGSYYVDPETGRTYRKM
jgi:hypothetical protein